MIGTLVELARTGVGLSDAVRGEQNNVVRHGVHIAGGRHVVQAALTLAVPELRVVGVVVDGLHALSMVAVAMASRKYRRPAMSQAWWAAAFAAAEVWALREEQ